MKNFCDPKGGKLNWTKPSIQTIDFRQTENKQSMVGAEMGPMVGS
jgi:hypothetical protein